MIKQNNSKNKNKTQQKKLRNKIKITKMIYNQNKKKLNKMN